MTEMNPHALSVLTAYGITSAQWIAEHGYQGEWTGDTCGCSDDRCIGHHHDPTDECQCLHVLINNLLSRRPEARCTCCADARDATCHLSGELHLHDAPGDR